jgi:hypothetical protein
VSFAEAYQAGGPCMPPMHASNPTPTILITDELVEGASLLDVLTAGRSACRARLDIEQTAIRS